MVEPVDVGSIRDTLFGDMPREAWCAVRSHAEPWTAFASYSEQLERGDSIAAVNTLQSIVAIPGLESRHYAQAWTFLRDLDVNPPESEARRVLGVVVEAALPQGLDLLAAWEDHAARYYNFSGAGIVWERPDSSLDDAIDAVLDAGRTIAAMIGPWQGDRPGPPPTGQVRLNLVTPAGLMFGQGPMEALAGDPMAGALLRAAIQLMQALIAKSTFDPDAAEP